MKEKLIPVGILEPQTGASYVAFGNDNKTSDLLADAIESWINHNMAKLRINDINRLLINADNGSECNSHRRQFLLRMIQLADKYSLTIHLAYYPPYHSKYNPIEHYWGGLERSWNGYLLDSVNTVIQRASCFTWRSVKTIATKIFGVYPKGVNPDKSENKEIAERLKRSETLPWYEVSIKPMTS